MIVSPLSTEQLGASNLGHFLATGSASGPWPLTPENLEKINAIIGEHPGKINHYAGLKNLFASSDTVIIGSACSQAMSAYLEANGDCASEYGDRLVIFCDQGVLTDSNSNTLQHQLPVRYPGMTAFLEKGVTLIGLNERSEVLYELADLQDTVRLINTEENAGQERKKQMIVEFAENVLAKTGWQEQAMMRLRNEFSYGLSCAWPDPLVNKMVYYKLRLETLLAACQMETENCDKALCDELLVILGYFLKLWVQLGKFKQKWTEAVIEYTRLPNKKILVLIDYSDESATRRRKTLNALLHLQAQVAAQAAGAEKMAAYLLEEKWEFEQQMNALDSAGRQAMLISIPFAPYRNSARFNDFNCRQSASAALYGGPVKRYVAQGESMLLPGESGLEIRDDRVRFFPTRFTAGRS